MLGEDCNYRTGTSYVLFPAINKYNDASKKEKAFVFKRLNTIHLNKF